MVPELRARPLFSLFLHNMTQKRVLRRIMIPQPNSSSLTMFMVVPATITISIKSTSQQPLGPQELLICYSLSTLCWLPSIAISNLPDLRLRSLSRPSARCWPAYNNRYVAHGPCPNFWQCQSTRPLSMSAVLEALSPDTSQSRSNGEALTK